jgi:hypothetical protein
MYDPKFVAEAIRTAEGAAESRSEYKNETYFAILLASLLSSGRGAVALHQAPPSSAAEVASAIPQKPYSAAELFAIKKWSSEVDKVMLAAYFLETYSHSQNYTVAELRDLLLTAKVGAPKNINLAILQAVQRGWMMELKPTDGGRKAWALTQTGLKQVAAMAENETA